MKILKPLLGIGITLIVSAGLATAGAQGSVNVAGIPLFALCASIGFVLHWLVFVPSFFARSEHYFDLTGSLSFLATVGIALLLHPAPDYRALLLGVLISLWALRLGAFLFYRVKKTGRDSRFDDIKIQFWRFLFTWTLGGAWVFITMAAALAAMTGPGSAPPGLLAGLGTLLWLGGFSFEVIADYQKLRFRADPDNRDKFISHGLWSLSRHPNYFGEILLWIGIALIAVPALSGWQWLTLVSPLFVILLLTRISGIPMLENKAEQRWGTDPAYQDYVAKTPVLVPRPGR